MYRIKPQLKLLKGSIEIEYSGVVLTNELFVVPNPFYFWDGDDYPVFMVRRVADGWVVDSVRSDGVIDSSDFEKTLEEALGSIVGLVEFGGSELWNRQWNATIAAYHEMYWDNPFGPEWRKQS